MLMPAAFGFIVGNAFGDSFRHRKCLEQANEDLRDRLENAHPDEELLCQELKRLRGEINDIHKHVVTVSKALQKRPS
jgi:predicted nuclease with TOPRIM domain